MRHSTVIVVSYVRRGAKDAKPRGKQVFRSREAYVETTSHETNHSTC